MSRRRWDQNTTQVANRLNRTRATYVWLLQLTPWSEGGGGEGGWIVLYRPYSAGILHSVSDQMQTYQITSPPQTKWPVKTTLRGWCLKFFRPWVRPLSISSRTQTQSAVAQRVKSEMTARRTEIRRRRRLAGCLSLRTERTETSTRRQETLYLWVPWREGEGWRAALVSQQRGQKERTETPTRR